MDSAQRAIRCAAHCDVFVLLNTTRHEAQRRAQQRAQDARGQGQGQGRGGGRAQVPERGKDWLDPCSSGVYFEGWKEDNYREGWLEELARRKARGKAERIAEERAKLVLPVTEAGTWLLKTGWRQRWGLISLNEVPGPEVRAAHEVHATRKTAER